MNSVFQQALPIRSAKAVVTRTAIARLISSALPLVKVMGSAKADAEAISIARKAKVVLVQDGPILLVNDDLSNVYNLNNLNKI